MHIGPFVAIEKESGFLFAMKEHNIGKMVDLIVTKIETNRKQRKNDLLNRSLKRCRHEFKKANFRKQASLSNSVGFNKMYA